MPTDRAAAIDPELVEHLRLAAGSILDLVDDDGRVSVGGDLVERVDGVDLAREQLAVGRGALAPDVVLVPKSDGLDDARQRTEVGRAEGHVGEQLEPPIPLRCRDDGPRLDDDGAGSEGRPREKDVRLCLLSASGRTYEVADGEACDRL